MKDINIEKMNLTDFKIINKDMLDTAKEMYKDLYINNEKRCKRKCSTCPFDPTNLYEENNRYCTSKDKSLIKFLKLCKNEGILKDFNFENGEDIEKFQIEDVMKYMFKYWRKK